MMQLKKPLISTFIVKMHGGWIRDREWLKWDRWKICSRKGGSIALEGKRCQSRKLFK
jgi:hypothetical protein